jgi:NADP-dependent 3-hydroxy acid dehydrogenase YdfG
MHYDPYFYPLDKINNWNKIYGKKGFIQYQFILPIANSYEGVNEILGILSKYKLGSFLAVLKLFGKSHENRYLHFPMEGYTLALDIKVSPTIWSVLDELDEIVNKFNGKIYLTKDARMNKLSYEKQYINRLSNTTKFFSYQMTRLSNTNNHCFLIIGANSDIAKATALKYLVKYPNGHLLLASRNINELNEFVQLNNIQNQSNVIFYDITPTTNNKQFIDSLPYKPTWIMYAAGVLVENESAIQNQAVWENNAYVNYTGAIAILNELMNDNNPFLNRIIGISSIAGLRGRKSNYIYGSAKSGFHQYLFGLRQSLKSNNILVQAITPGFVKTKMTKNIPLNKLANTADQVAEAIISDSKSFEVYPNLFWWGISRIVKYSPNFILKYI